MNQPTKNKRLSVAVLLLMLVLQTHAVVSAGEYYIVNNFWGKLLSCNSDRAPRLMSYDSSNDADFLFVAEASGTSGYVMLRHKSTGLYLTASTSNAWSVLLSGSGSGDEYLWAVDQLFDTHIVSKKNAGTRLGSDFYSGSTYYFSADEVPVYYNKDPGALSWYSVIPSNGNGFEASRKVAKTAVFTNEYGVEEQDDYCVSEPVEVTGIDYHIISTTPFENFGSVNLNGRTSWLVFESIRPSKVISSYLGNVTIDGQKAQNGVNCRVEIWMRGAVVIPLPAEAPFVATTDEGTFSVPLGNTSDLGSNSNKARSFILKRGYMATVATGKSGGDYSRVYVADHADLTVTLPTALDQRISSVYVRNWHYTSKAGYCSTKNDLLSATVACGGSWAWNWDAGSTSSADVEYVPIKQHLYWPSDGNFDKAGSTAMMLFNEPEHSEQHTSSKCSCGGTIDEWKAYQNTSKFNATGLRIGSPSATSLSWIKNYLTHCDNMKQRCDFSCTHGYWTTEWANNLNTLKSYGRPIWITEWEYGASWTSGSNPSSADDARAKVFDILERLEYNDYVERYSYYEFDTGGTNGWMRELFWENNASKGLAYVGEVYARVKPHFGYKASIQPVPNWWAPSASQPAITGVAKLSDGQYTLYVNNANADATATFQVQRKAADGSWLTVYDVTDRSTFEPTKLSLAVPSGLFDAGDEIRVVITTLYDSAHQESEAYAIRDYAALEALKNLEFNDGTFVGANVRTYAKDITGNETSGQNDVDGWDIPANGDARAAGQFPWGASYFLGNEGSVAPAANSEGSTTGGALGLLACWTGTAQYTQNVFLEPGTYTLSFAVYNAPGGTETISKNLFGFIADDGTEYLSQITRFPTNRWTMCQVSFVLNEGTYGKLSLGYTAANAGSGNQPHLFVDYLRITKNDVATPGNLQNLTFDEGSFTTVNLRARSSQISDSDTEASGPQPVTAWYCLTETYWTQTGQEAWNAAGQQAWNSGLFLTNPNFVIPATDSRGKTEGGALAMVAAWNSRLQLTQPAMLPAGSYTLTARVYNVAGASEVTKNLFGFVTNAGTEYLASDVTFAEAQWSDVSVEFTLEEDTPGWLSVGYVAGNFSSTLMPKLYVDYVQLSDGTQQWPSFLIGDVNKDGVVSIADVTALVNIILGKGFDPENADVNADGAITIADVTALVNILLGK